MSEIDSRHSRIYREASSEEPPAALDAAILDAARKQVAKPERHARSPWLRWMAPASAIATLVLGVSIALLVEREQPETTRDMSIHPIRSLQSPSTARTTESDLPKPADSLAPEMTAKPEVPAPTAPLRAPTATSPAQAPAALPAPAAPVLAPRPAEVAPAAAQAFPAESRAKAVESKLSAPGAAAESNAAADSALGGPGAAAPAAPAAAVRLAPLRQQATQRSPEAWLADISRLRREGRDKEAAEQLAEFRIAYPAYAVPENLLK